MPRKSKLRVIVDTNCWISFLIGRRLSNLVDLLSNERIQLVLCNELLEEIRDVTSRPKFAKYFPKKDLDFPDSQDSSSLRCRRVVRGV